MIDFVEAIHYLIGGLIVIFLLFIIIKIHNYFSKDNIVIYVRPAPVGNSMLNPTKK